MLVSVFIFFALFHEHDFTAAASKKFPINLKYFKQCDFHLTFHQFTDLSELFINTNQYTQPWTVYTLGAGYPMLKKQNVDPRIISKEVCDVNMVMTPVYMNDIYVNIDSFRGMRENSVFIIIWYYSAFQYQATNLQAA